MKLVIGNKKFHLQQEENTDLSDYIYYYYFSSINYFELSFYFKILRNDYNSCFYCFTKHYSHNKTEDIIIDISEFNDQLKFTLDFQDISNDLQETIINSIIDEKIRILL